MRTPRASLAAIGLVVFSLSALAQSPADQGWPPSEQLITQFKAGKYKEVIEQAPAVIQAEPWNNELRLAYASSLLWSSHEWDAVIAYEPLLETEVGVEARLGMANGLAWTGRMHEAVPHYKLLLGGPKGDEAKLGLAHALRWMGREDLALPYYNELRAAHPNTHIGEEGQYFARRALRARTGLGFTHLRDNTPMRRNEPLLSHTWRDGSKAWIFGLEATGGHDWDEQRRLDRSEYGLRVENLEMWGAPRLTLSHQDDPRGRTFGELRLKATDWPLYVHLGRVNFGKLAFTTEALEQGLTANRYGIEGKYQIRLGEIRGNVFYYDISDGNSITAADVRFFTSRWRPWGPEIRFYGGTNLRYASHRDPDYWSPKKYALGFVGIEGEWERRHWYFYAQGQVGFKIAGEASTSWAAGVVVKRWLGDDWALGLNAYALSGTREAKYRAEGVTVLVEKLW